MSVNCHILVGPTPCSQSYLPCRYPPTYKFLSLEAFKETKNALYLKEDEDDQAANGAVKVDRGAVAGGKQVEVEVAEAEAGAGAEREGAKKEVEAEAEAGADAGGSRQPLQPSGCMGA